MYRHGMEWKLNAFGIFAEWIIANTSVNDENEKCPIKSEIEINAKHNPFAFGTKKSSLIDF